MVKHVHVTIDDKEHEELNKNKGKLSWKEVLIKGANKK